MPFTPKFVDLVRNLTSVTGTGPVTLGQAVNGYTSLAAAVSPGDQFYYCIQGVDKPAEREVGRGTMQSDGKVARQPVTGPATSFSTGTKTIALVAAAEWFAKLDGAMPGAASRAELAARDGGSAYLGEAGRAGWFMFDPSNLSARISADPAQGIHVPPASDPSGSSGAWVRRFDGAVNVKWFGATGDGTTNDGAAFVAALATLKAIAVNQDVYYQGSPRLFVPAGHYYLGTTTLDVSHTLILEGESGVGGGISSKLRWAAATTGIRVQSANTSGASGVVAPGFNSGSGSVIRNLTLMGGWTLAGGESEHHGIHLRASATIENFAIDNFPGDGIHAQTTATGGGADEGNSNCTAIKRGIITNCRDGLFIDGADANVWLTESINVTYARRWGVWDSSFLGNTHLNIHTANCGLVIGTTPTIVSHSGKRYTVNPGEAAWCSANAPTGTAASNQGWAYYQPGGPETGFLNIPAWSNGLTVREGGGFKTDNANARNQLIGCYTEGGQAPSQLISPTLVIGGLWGSPIVNHDPVMDEATIMAADGSLNVPNKAFFGNLFAGKKVSTASIFTLHNVNAMTAGYRARQDFAVGYEADGVTPASLASIYAYANTASPATAEGQIIFATRAYTTGVMTDRLQLDGANFALSPTDDLGLQLGVSARRYKEVHVGAAGGIKVDGNKVVGARGAALPADATDLASAIALVNAVKARMVAHGLVA
jgi:hypothetical protein